MGVRKIYCLYLKESPKVNKGKLHAWTDKKKDMERFLEERSEKMFATRTIKFENVEDRRSWDHEMMGTRLHLNKFWSDGKVYTLLTTMKEYNKFESFLVNLYDILVDLNGESNYQFTADAREVVYPLTCINIPGCNWGCDRNIEQGYRLMDNTHNIMQTLDVFIELWYQTFFGMEPEEKTELQIMHDHLITRRMHRYDAGEDVVEFTDTLERAEARAVNGEY